MAALGDRATYRGQRCIIVAAAPFLEERRWIVRWRSGYSATGWTHDAAPESGLTGVSSRSWVVGDTVMVGWSPFRQQGTVTSVIVGLVEGRPIYTVTLEAEIKRFPDEIPPYALNMGESVVEVGAEHLDTHDRDD